MNEESHQEFVRSLQCLWCGRSPCEAAHVRYSDARFNKKNPGIGAKPHNRWCVPLCPDCHRGVKGQHTRGERKWWEEKGIDPLQVADALWKVSGNYEKACQIVRHAYFHS